METNNVYNLEQLEIATIKKCLDENKDLSLNKISKLLGISERTLHRKFKQYNLTHVSSKISKTIEFLEKRGYKVQNLNI